MLKLKEIREERNVTQIELAKAINVTPGTISNWESGIRQPDYKILINIANYFDISMDQLLGRNYTGDINTWEDYINKKDKVQPIFSKILKVNEAYLPRIEGFVEGLVVATRINNKK